MRFRTADCHCCRAALALNSHFARLLAKQHCFTFLRYSTPAHVLGICSSSNTTLQAMAANMVIDQGAAPDEAQYGDGQPQLDKFRLRWELARLPALEPPAGEVSFDDKRAPTEQGHSLSTGTFCFLRGRSDVSRLKARLERDDDFVWSDEYATEHNVTLARPSHDGWGIRKLAFVFCDDFLHRVYRLPLWEDPSWRALIDPVLESCGVPRERIIRCLLASMPPRTVIPPHHDSGYWVPRSRRLHCAIKTNPDVVFLAGRTFDEMHRIEFKEGCVVELNNQAKHYVANLSDEYRTHLIFDYVDDRAEPYLLPPEMPVVQLAPRRRVAADAAERGLGVGARLGPAGASYPDYWGPEGGDHLHVRVPEPAPSDKTGRAARDAFFGLALAGRRRR